MSATKMLAAVYTEPPRTHQRPRPREREALHRNKHKRCTMDADSLKGRWHHWQPPPSTDDRVLTLMYVRSHHPSVKQRVSRIIGDVWQEKQPLYMHKIHPNTGKNGFQRCHSLQTHSHPSFSLQDSFKLKMLEEDHGLFVGKAVLLSPPIPKPSKPSSQEPKLNPRRTATRPKTGILPPRSTEKQTTPQRRIRTAVCRDSPPPIKNNSFVGWEQNGFDQEQFLH